MGITLINTGFTYLPGTPMSREVLSCVNLELQAGEVLCLVGRTGAGKSTLIQVMSGLLNATRGEIALDGKHIEGRGGIRALRNEAGVLLQTPEKQLFAETVKKDVAFGPRNQGRSSEQTAELVRGALASAGLDPDAYSSRSPFSLSAGEMRRAALAGVLAMRPRYLLLDEPSSGLDPSGRESLYRTLREQRERGVGILLATHDWDEVEMLADRIAVLSHGEIPLQGKKEPVLTAVCELEASGLQAPAVVALLAELRLRGLEIPVFLTSPEEAASLIRESLGGRQA